MDNVSDLLKRNGAHNEPPEITAIKKYVLSRHGSVVQVGINARGYSITVPNGSLATTLRMDQPALRQQCNLDPKRKLFIRIGHF